MFDLENERPVTHSCSEETRVSLSVEQIAKIADLALLGGSKYQEDWKKSELAELANTYLANGRTAWSRFWAEAYARNQAEAVALAKEAIAGYPEYMLPWEAANAVTLAKRWKDISQGLAINERYDLPAAEFDELRKWAGLA